MLGRMTLKGVACHITTWIPACQAFEIIARDFSDLFMSRQMQYWEAMSPAYCLIVSRPRTTATSFRSQPSDIRYRLSPCSPSCSHSPLYLAVTNGFAQRVSLGCHVCRVCSHAVSTGNSLHDLDWLRGFPFYPESSFEGWLYHVCIAPYSCKPLG